MHRHNLTIKSLIIIKKNTKNYFLMENNKTSNGIKKN